MHVFFHNSGSSTQNYTRWSPFGNLCKKHLHLNLPCVYCLDQTPTSSINPALSQPCSADRRILLNPPTLKPAPAFVGTQCQTSLMVLVDLTVILEDPFDDTALDTLSLYEMMDHVHAVSFLVWVLRIVRIHDLKALCLLHMVCDHRLPGWISCLVIRPCFSPWWRGKTVVCSETIFAYGFGSRCLSSKAYLITLLTHS